MKWGLRLRTRGLLLVAFPLISQLIIVGVLTSLLWKLQGELLKQSNSRQLITMACDMSVDLLDFTTSLFLERDFAFLDTEKSKRANQLAALRRQLSQVLEYARKNLSEDRQVNQFKYVAQDMLATIETVWHEQARGAEHWKQVNGTFDPLSLQKTLDFALALNDMLCTEESAHRPQAAVERQMGEQIKTVLLLGLLGCPAMAILLGLIYSNQITRPLRQLTENSRRLSYRQPLLPAKPGVDEFAQLDLVLHSVADSINTAIASDLAMVANAADLICSLDASGVFVKANPYAKTMLGFSSDYLVGKALVEVAVAEEALHVEDSITAACHTAETTVFDLRLQRHDGTILDTRWSTFWSPPENNLFCVVHDITEEKSVERMKQDFIDMVSHDLRSPLASTLASLELIASNALGEVNSEAAGQIGAITVNIEKLIDFVNDLLDFQKLQAGQMPLAKQSCDVVPIFAESAQKVKALAEAKEVAIVLPTGAWKLNCDEQKVGQVVTNLLSNAIKFSPRGQQVSIDLTEFDHDLEVTITDNGPGIPLAYRQKIFDAFEQVPESKGTQEGTGLGLAICKQIVEAHGGVIGVRERSPCGSIFWFRLPK